MGVSPRLSQSRYFPSRFFSAPRECFPSLCFVPDSPPNTLLVPVHTQQLIPTFQSSIIVDTFHALQVTDDVRFKRVQPAWESASIPGEWDTPNPTKRLPLSTLTNHIVHRSCKVRSSVLPPPVKHIIEPTDVSSIWAS